MRVVQSEDQNENQVCHEHFNLAKLHSKNQVSPCFRKKSQFVMWKLSMIINLWSTTLELFERELGLKMKTVSENAMTTKIRSEFAWYEEKVEKLEKWLKSWFQTISRKIIKSRFAGAHVIINELMLQDVLVVKNQMMKV